MPTKGYHTFAVVSLCGSNKDCSNYSMTFFSIGSTVTPV